VSGPEFPPIDQASRDAMHDITPALHEINEQITQNTWMQNHENYTDEEGYNDPLETGAEIWGDGQLPEDFTLAFFLGPVIIVFLAALLIMIGAIIKSLLGF